jgi:hypothetical protein
LTVEALRFEGGNLTADVTGAVGLNVPYPNNPVEGVVSLKADDRVATDLGFFLAFFPGGRASDGTYTARLGGTLGSVALSPMVAHR